MAPWAEVLVAAFTAQLLALPGEKGQFVIAALATRYNPYLVVAGAATAFGGWTVLEIVVGEALQGALPAVYLDAATAVLFVAFAVWLLAADVSEESVDVGTPNGGRAAERPGSDPARAGDISLPRWLGGGSTREFGGYLSALSAMGLAEFGDKTQLITISLAAQYGADPAIWVGEMLAIVPVSLLTALFAHRFAGRVNARWVRRIAAGTFLVFAVDIAAGIAFGVSVLPL